MQNALFPNLATNSRSHIWPVWSGSTREDVRFIPVPKKAAIKLYHQARHWNCLRLAGRYGGAIGNSAMRVLESLIFDFLNYRTGRCDPSYDGIALRTGLGRSTIAVALKRLAELGIINWLRRCAEDQDENGQWRLRQQTNAYAILPSSQWKGYNAPPEPVVDPETWGATPSLPCLLDQVIADRKKGGGIKSTLARLADDPTDSLAAALASLGRALHNA